MALQAVGGKLTAMRVLMTVGATGLEAAKLCTTKGVALDDWTVAQPAIHRGVLVEKRKLRIPIVLEFQRSTAPAFRAVTVSATS
jgi:hypothetical protein